jgi:hypothetical protein
MLAMQAIKLFGDGPAGILASFIDTHDAPRLAAIDVSQRRRTGRVPQ